MKKMLIFLALLTVVQLAGCSSPQEKSGIRTTPINRPQQWEKSSMMMPGGVSF